MGELKKGEIQRRGERRGGRVVDGEKSQRLRIWDKIIIIGGKISPPSRPMPNKPSVDVLWGGHPC
jgi:hypothetical protein